jgi:hypothetical protein
MARSHSSDYATSRCEETERVYASLEMFLVSKHPVKGEMKGHKGLDGRPLGLYGDVTDGNLARQWEKQ